MAAWLWLAMSNSLSSVREQLSRKSTEENSTEKDEQCKVPGPAVEGAD